MAAGVIRDLDLGDANIELGLQFSIRTVVINI